MKIYMLALAIFLFLSCKETPKTVPEETIAEKVEENLEKPRYPKAFADILDAHGGLAQWRTKRTISFEMPKSTGTEKQTIDLYSRKEKIVMPNVSMGFDGKDFWILDTDGRYKGDPVFYHNLMFYFYAMPFVLADDGIVYSKTQALEFEGKSYPGIRISYENGIGISSKDEYFLHYDAETDQMAWLGYTVTYRSGEKSDDIKWIRYKDWTAVEGLILPKSLNWYAVADGKITTVRNERPFENISLSETALPDSFYAVPSNAKVVTKQ